MSNASEPASKKGRSWLRWLVPVAAVIYAISPVDLFPEAVFPILGYLDDAGVLAAAFSWWLRHARRAKSADSPAHPRSNPADSPYGES